jgi:hypothetical protein
MNLERAPHLYCLEQERIVEGLMNHHSLRHVATAWLTVVTLLGAPAIATGRFVCLKGMPQAGAACPRCHGQQADNACCKWIEPAPTSGVHVAGPTIASPTSLAFLTFAEPAVQQLPSAVSSTSLSASPPGSSPSRATILRL